MRLEAVSATMLMLGVVASAPGCASRTVFALRDVPSADASPESAATIDVPIEVGDFDGSPDSSDVFRFEFDTNRADGACGSVCCEGNACIDGRCVARCGDATPTACPGPPRSCNGEVCVDLASDPAHCGGCDRACCAGEICHAGVCVNECPTGQSSCAVGIDGCRACVSVASDPNNCGACGAACGAGCTCAGGVCDCPCPAGTTRCGGSCVDLSSDADHCGSCSTICPPSVHGVPTCTARTCGVQCEGGYVDDAGRCVPSRVRALAPTSTSIVTTTRPTLHWETGVGADGARVEICRDRALTSACMIFDAVGRDARVSSALAPGAWFWRLTALGAGVPVSPPGPVWQFVAPVRDSALDTHWVGSPDVNGDGLADVVVGSPGTLSERGAVSVFLGAAGGPAAVPSMVLAGAMGARSLLGISVRSAGDTNGDGYGDIVAMASDSDTTLVVFHGSASGLSLSRVTRIGVGHVSYGAVATGVGDVDGDGFDDVALGVSRVGDGAVYIYSGASNGIASTPSVSIPTPLPMCAFGAAVAPAGDVNGDGFADVVVGAPQCNSAFVFAGSPGGLSRVPFATFHGEVWGTPSYGFAVEGAGDMNGDGYSDVVIGDGSPYSLMTGTVDLYAGSTGSLSSVPAHRWTIASSEDIGEFGAALALGSDVDGDGYSDLVVGAPASRTRSGAILVFRGGDSLADTPIATIHGTDGPARAFGYAIGHGGDLDGDGFGEVLVSAPDASSYLDGGYVYVFGGGIAPSTTPFVRLHGPDMRDDFGSSIALAPFVASRRGRLGS